MTMRYEAALEKHLYTRASQMRTPISGTFELLPVCNLDCKMCYVKKSMSDVRQSGGLRSADEWISLGRKAVDAGMLFLLLTGGEPFLFPEFERLYRSLHKMGLVIDVNTNGTLLGEEEIAWLQKSQPRHIKISLYGASESSYEALCGNGAAFSKVIRAFELAKRAGITVYSSITVTPGNYKELDEMLALCEAYRIPVQATSYMFPPYRSNQAHIQEQYRLCPEDAARATMNIFQKTSSAEDFFEKAAEYTKDIYQNYKEYIQPGHPCGMMECRAGFCTFWVTWKGEMVPCAMMEYGKYPVMAGYDFHQAWKNINDIVNHIATPSECVQCPAKKACYSCAASAFCEMGDTAKKPEYPCEMTSHYMRLMKEEFLRQKQIILREE